MGNERNEVLARLDVLVGRWQFEVVVDGAAVAKAQVEGAWHEDGAYLIQRAEGEPPGPETPQHWIDNSPLPTVTIIGLDDASETFTALYSDARDVFRVYGMTLDGNQWTMSRVTPGFNQRLVATIDGDSITGAWERSADNADWFVDFEFRYTRL
jgi:hypothetical protein